MKRVVLSYIPLSILYSQYKYCLVNRVIDNEFYTMIPTTDGGEDELLKVQNYSSRYSRFW